MMTRTTRPPGRAVAAKDRAHATGGPSRGQGWRALVGWFGTVAGLFGAGIATATTHVAAQEGDYRTAASAPAAWHVFARQLQSSFEQQLMVDDEAALRFQGQLEKRAESGSAAPAALGIRAWILPDGRVERLEFDRLDPESAVNLRVLLSRGNVGAPPAGMLQPVHLRLALRRDKQPAQGQ